MKHWIEVTGAWDDNKIMVNLNNVSAVYENNTNNNTIAKSFIYCVGDTAAIHVKDTYDEIVTKIKNSI